MVNPGRLGCQRRDRAGRFSRADVRVVGRGLVGEPVGPVAAGLVDHEPARCRWYRTSVIRLGGWFQHTYDTSAGAGRDFPDRQRGHQCSRFSDDRRLPSRVVS